MHGEAAAQGEAVVVGCETGVLVYKGGTITKIVSPTPYGRIGNQAGSDVSPITLGDYKQDKDAELERPTTISLINTETNSLKLVDIGTSYTFRSLARGAQGEGLVLGTDGQIHVIDPGSRLKWMPASLIIWRRTVVAWMHTASAISFCPRSLAPAPLSKELLPSDLISNDQLDSILGASPPGYTNYLDVTR